MNTPHPLAVLAESQAALEAVGPEFIKAGLYRARDKTKAVFETLKASLKEGMTEDEGRKMTLDVFANLGVKKHWHRPYVRFGLGTSLCFNDPVQPNYHLQKNDACYIDLGPVWRDDETGIEYEGDYGRLICFRRKRRSSKMWR